MEYAKDKYLWSDENCKKIIWRDVTKKNIFGSDGRQYIRWNEGTEYEKSVLIIQLIHPNVSKYSGMSKDKKELESSRHYMLSEIS